MADKCFGIYFTNGSEEKLLTNLISFNYFIRSRLKEFMYASVKEMLDRTKNDDNIIDIKLELNQIFYLVGIKTSEVTALIFTMDLDDHDSLIILAKYIISKGLAETINDNFELITSKNKINKIKSDIDETKYIMIDNIDLLLARGEKLEDLVKKTEYLSETSKIFYDNTKKLNRCCLIV